jgi:autotransporter-associated beta strand protein
MKISPIGKAISQALKNYTNTYTHSTAFKLVGAILATTFVIAPVQATERKWSGCSFCSTNNWNEETILGSTHWSPNQLPNNGDSLLFDNLFPTVTNNNFSDLDVSNIKFTNAFSNRWVTGNQIDLIVAAGDGIQSYTDATITFDTALSLQGSRSITVNTSGVTTSGNIVLNGNITDSVLNNNTHDLFPSIIKTGQGKLTLGGNNSSMYGDIDVQSGTLVLKEGNVLSDNTTVDLSSGTVLDVNGTGEDFGGLTGSGNVDLSNGGSIIVGYNNEHSRFEGQLVDNAFETDGAFGKAGSGTLTLSGDNSFFAGDITVYDGTLRLLSSSDLSTSSTVIVKSAGTFDLSGTVEEFGGLSGSGDFKLGGGIATVGLNGDDTTFSGVISGETGQFIKAGGGTTKLTGFNTYTGGTTINGGSLEGNAHSLQGDIVNNANLTLNQSGTGFYNSDISGTGTLTKTATGIAFLNNTDNSYSGETRIQQGILVFNGSSTGSENSGVNISNGAQLFVNGNNSSKYLSGNGNVTIDRGNLTIGDGNGQTFSGVIRDRGAGTGSLT